MVEGAKKKQLRFRAGEVGFVFYEDSGFPGIADGRTYAFGSIGEAAAWLIRQYSEPALGNGTATATA